MRDIWVKLYCTQTIYKVWHLIGSVIAQINVETWGHGQIWEGWRFCYNSNCMSAHILNWLRYYWDLIACRVHKNIAVLSFQSVSEIVIARLVKVSLKGRDSYNLQFSNLCTNCLGTNSINRRASLKIIRKLRSYKLMSIGNQGKSIYYKWDKYPHARNLHIRLDCL